MATASGIILALQTQLKNSSNLDFIEDPNISLGLSEKKIKGYSIDIEPIRNDEEDFVYNKQNCEFEIEVIGWITAQVDKDDLVANGIGATVKGIMDLENAIKKAISEDRTLGVDGVVFTRITDTTYDYNAYPNRSVNLFVTVTFRQDTNTRA